MKRFCFILLSIFFLFLNIFPSSFVFADDGYTDSQLADIGTLMLANMIASGEASELDFSDYTENDALDWLIAFGEMAVTGDTTGLVEQGLDWLGDLADDTYNSLIESIREWEHDIAPDLYDWWYQGSQYEYKLQPASNISRPLGKLLRGYENSVQPQPDPDFSFISNVNLVYFSDNSSYSSKQDFYNSVCKEYSNPSYTIPGFNPKRATAFFVRDSATYHTTGYWQYGQLCAYVPLTINIHTDPNDDTATVIYSSRQLSTFIENNPTYDQSCYYYWAYGNGTIMQQRSNITNPSYANNWQTSFVGLSTAINYIYSHFANIDLYVNNAPWVLRDDNGSYPLTIPGKLTVLNYDPAQYTFSTPTYIDLTGLKTLITNAINSSDILSWQDIDDYFVDVNGVQALPTISIIRNDYDNLYMEQYPYPAKLIGFQDPLKFNEHMLDNVSGQYLTPMVDVAENTVNILPNELKWVLGIGAILSIFALIINRLLE